MLFNRFVLLVMLFFGGYGSMAVAHNGHDHSHWSSPLLHALFLLSLAAAGLCCVFVLYRMSCRLRFFKS